MTYPFLNSEPVSESEVSGLKKWNALGEICSQQFVSDSRDSGWSEFGQTGLVVFVSGIDLIVKTHKKKFPRYHWFRAQRIYYITIVVCSYECGAEKILSLSNILPMSIVQQWAVYPNVHTLIKSMLTTSCTTASLERAVMKYLQNHCREEWLNCNCSAYLASQCKSELLEINIGLLA